METVVVRRRHKGFALRTFAVLFVTCRIWPEDAQNLHPFMLLDVKGTKKHLYLICKCYLTTPSVAKII